MGKTSGHWGEGERGQGGDEEELKGGKVQKHRVEQQQGCPNEPTSNSSATNKSTKDKLLDEDLDKLVIEVSRQVSQATNETDNDNPGEQALLSNNTNRLQHDRSTSSQPKRPMNAFMVWGQAIRRHLHHRFSNVQNASLSKALGRIWRVLNAQEKEPFIKKANLIKANHKRDYPNYRYQPRRIHERRARSSMLIGINLNRPFNQQVQTPASSSVYNKPDAFVANQTISTSQTEGAIKLNSSQTSYIDRQCRYSGILDSKQSVVGPYDSQVYSNSMQSVAYSHSGPPIKEAEYRGVPSYNSTASSYSQYNSNELTYPDQLQSNTSAGYVQNHQISAYNPAQHNYHQYHQHQQQLSSSLVYDAPMQQGETMIARNQAASYSSNDGNCHILSVQSSQNNSLLLNHDTRGRYSQISRPHESSNQAGFVDHPI